MSDFVICLALFFVGGWIGLGIRFGCWIWDTMSGLFSDLWSRLRRGHKIDP